jgi:hypothetical protein
MCAFSSVRTSTSIWREVVYSAGLLRFACQAINAFVASKEEQTKQAAQTSLLEEVSMRRALGIGLRPKSATTIDAAAPVAAPSGPIVLPVDNILPSGRSACITAVFVYAMLWSDGALSSSATTRCRTSDCLRPLLSGSATGIDATGVELPTTSWLPCLRVPVDVSLFDVQLNLQSLDWELWASRELLQPWESTEQTTGIRYIDRFALQCVVAHVSSVVSQYTSS